MITEFPALLEKFFTERLMQQRNVSPHTLAAYRDTFRLILAYAQQRLKKQPSDLSFKDVSVPFILGFLEHLQKDRGNTPRSRNARLAAIHSFFRYLSYERPEHSTLAQRVLAIPCKIHEKRLVEHLTPNEAKALVSVPDCKTKSGRRDTALITLVMQTGLRVSETTALRCQDIVLGRTSHVQCVGKGRKHRCLPLTRETASVMRQWLLERSGGPLEPVFPNARGTRLSSDGVAYILRKHAKAAADKCESLRNKRVTPHVLRHTTAMNLYRSGVDRSVIALWLGHEAVDTTQCYLEADTAMKEKVLRKSAGREARVYRFRPTDHLLEFLNNL